MYNSLLLETGGGIISQSQVSPQQGDACVMIGIGGTGVAALRKLKKAVYQHLEPDEHTEDSVPRYDKIRFLAIDTDTKDWGKNGSDISEISPNEQFSIHKPNLQQLLVNTDQLHKEGNLAWMNMDNINMKGTEGAGGVRQVGRYCLIKKSSELKAKISELVVGAKAASGKSEVHVHIFAGISGGTGSGCFIDVCYIVREILKNMAGHVYGYFFLPDIQLYREGIIGQEVIKEYNKQNGYAAFRELDYLMSLPSSHEYFEQKYGNFTVKSQLPPVDLCHLISGTDSNGVVIPNAYDYGLNIVADYVLSYLSKVNADANDDIGLTIAGHLANVAMGVKMIKPKYGAERGYHILGISSAELPLTHIGTYLAAKTYDKMQVSLERHSSEEILFNVAGAMGYTFEGIRKLVIEGVNFKPRYNMDAIGDPGVLNETENSWDNAIPAITQPITNCCSAAVGAMTANVKAQTTELQSYDFTKTEQIENPTFAAKLFNQLIMCCKSVNSGPTIAAELLHSDTSKDLMNIMDGIIAQANLEQNNLQANLSLRVQDICTTAHTYNKAHIGKRRKLQKYLDARDNYLKCSLGIEVCKRVVLMCSSFKLIISNLYADYFSPLYNMLHDLNVTFQANLKWLDTPANLINQDYCWRIFELEDIRDTLDETVLKPQQMDVEHTEFVNYLIGHFNEWKDQDSYRTGRCINKYMIDHFRTVLTQSVDQFLTVIFNEPDFGKLAVKIQRQVFDEVRRKAAPLFWFSPYFPINTANTCKYSIMSVPSVSTVIDFVTKNIRDATMVVRKCNIGDRITCVNFVSGIPLFAYQGLYELKSAYDNSNAAGMHLHEVDMNWKKILPTPIPYRYNPSATQNGEEKVALYYQAVEEKVVCIIDPDKPSEYVVRLIPDTAEMVSGYRKDNYFRKGNLLEADLNRDIQKLKGEREALLPNVVPSGTFLRLPNDGFTDAVNPENDYTERVRVDYFVRFDGIRKAAEKSLKYLQKIDDKIAEMESWKKEKKLSRKMIERYMCLYVIGKIKYHNNTVRELLNYRFKGFDEEVTLASPNMEYRSFRRYQAYLTLNKMDPEVLKELDRELEAEFETPVRSFGEKAWELIDELSEQALTNIKMKAEPLAAKDDILNFYQTLKEAAKELAEIFPRVDSEVKELREKLSKLEAIR
ncbi:MAG: tubulin-like doman-containing protein [Lachnospiraceae bacterium]